MANSNALITINEVMDGIMFKSKLPQSESMRVKQLVIDGYRELNTTTTKQGRVFELLSMDANYVMAMPTDLVSINDIFVPLDGTMWSLTRNVRIPIILDGTGATPTDWGVGGTINTDTGYGYGAKGGVNTEGYYTEDYVNRRIIFRNTLDRSEVLLDYLSSGINKDGATFIPEVAKSALEMYVMKELSLFGVLPINRFKLYDGEFKKQKGILRLYDFNITAFKDAVYRTITSTFRR